MFVNVNLIGIVENQTDFLTIHIKETH